MKALLIAVDDPGVVRSIQSMLRTEYRVESAPDKAAALEILGRKRYDLMFIDLDLLTENEDPANGVKTALGPFWKLYPSISVVVMTPPDRIRDAVAAVKAGASDFLTYPVSPEEVRHVTETIYESILLRSELDYLRDRFWKSESLALVQTRSPLMKSVFDKVRSVAPTKSTVLLIGETGTGKGVLARIIHRHSNRSEAQFISVHCGAIAETLIESELFGHEKGAFTGAVRRKLGKFEIAKGGTIFLDEIGTITPSAQIKLLQILQEETFQRVGGEEDITANVRVISATNIDLKQMCEEGLFRRDLYYRLDVFPIEIPPLRERSEDIPHFAELFLKKLNQFNPKQIHGLHQEVMNAFTRYPWPGNIREMENLMERAYILETSSILTPESFPSELFENTTALPQVSIDTTASLAEVRRCGIADIERNYLKEVLARHRGKINESAKAAGISTRQLHKLMQKYELRKETFK
ncbi:MAG: sigma-54 dependent transcriptional regulator [Desulfobacterales bacterium]|nr:sigma-54 dependent transcriptional regulator [Desulfobacterales bacterium]